MTYTSDNINEFFEDLMSKPNAKFNMLRVYGAYERECEENKRNRRLKKNLSSEIVIIFLILLVMIL